MKERCLFMKMIVPPKMSFYKVSVPQKASNATAYRKYNTTVRKIAVNDSIVDFSIRKFIIGEMKAKFDKVLKKVIGF